MIQFSKFRDCCGADGDDRYFEVDLCANGTTDYLYQQEANDEPAQINRAAAFGHPSAVTGGVPEVYGKQTTPTPTGSHPVPTTSNTGPIVFIILIATAALSFNSRCAILATELLESDPRSGWVRRSPLRVTVKWSDDGEQLQLFAGCDGVVGHLLRPRCGGGGPPRAVASPRADRR